jgi:hypothetical protein
MLVTLFNKVSFLKPSFVQQAVKVWSKLVSNEGHLTLEAETVFCANLPSHFSGVTDTSHLELLTHALQPLQVYSKTEPTYAQYAWKQIT